MNFHIAEEDASWGEPWKGSGEMTSIVHNYIVDSSPQLQFGLLSGALEWMDFYCKMLATPIYNTL